ncbi:hypothetical protein FGO68_gene10095 [Halteria grandinella]|uniref:Uncharacterized protein n=1 Tax=Halteria grandinella TaxID=5974 RepID=A0A8J8SUD9_HALGN|nr:hypothetical protein FGO68_gene10095 [Halteria grandinella]
MYDESTKTLILKVIDSDLYQSTSTEQIVGMGVYNAANCEFVGCVGGQRGLSEEEVREEYETGDIGSEKQTVEYREADKEFKRLLKDYQG